MATDSQILRDLLEDADGATFSDGEITAFLNQSNAYETLPIALPLSAIYWAAYLGWVRKAGKVRVKRQKIAIFSKDTKVTYDAMIAQANEYKNLSLSAPQGTGQDSIIGLTIPSLDTQTPLIDTSLDGTDIEPRNGLAEIW